MLKNFLNTCVWNILHQLLNILVPIVNTRNKRKKGKQRKARKIEEQTHAHYFFLIGIQLTLTVHMCSAPSSHYTLLFACGANLWHACLMPNIIASSCFANYNYNIKCVTHVSLLSFFFCLLKEYLTSILPRIWDEYSKLSKLLICFSEHSHSARMSSLRTRPHGMSFCSPFTPNLPLPAFIQRSDSFHIDPLVHYI